MKLNVLFFIIILLHLHLSHSREYQQETASRFSSDNSCVDKLEATGNVGDTLLFTICTKSPPDTYIHFSSSGWIQTGDMVDGYSWYKETIGDRAKITILFNITSNGDFSSEKVRFYGNNTKYEYDIQIRRQVTSAVTRILPTFTTSRVPQLTTQETQSTTIGTSVDNSCEDRLEATGDVGDTVVFIVCTDSPLSSYIHFSSTGWVHEGDKQYGYSWYKETAGDRTKISIAFNISRDEDFSTKTVRWYNVNKERLEYDLTTRRHDDATIIAIRTSETPITTEYEQQSFSSTQSTSFSSAPDTNCTDMLEVKGEVGDTVFFTICTKFTESPLGTYIHFSSDGWVHSGDDSPDGYSWYKETIGDSTKISIAFKITSTKDFGTERVRFNGDRKRHEYELRIRRREAGTSAAARTSETLRTTTYQRQTTPSIQSSAVGYIVDNRCVDKLDATGAVGDIVVFTICTDFPPPLRYIYFSSAGWVHKDGDNPDGYSWYTEQIGGRTKIYIVCKVSGTKEFYTEKIEFSAKRTRHEYELKIRSQEVAGSAAVRTWATSKSTRHDQQRSFSIQRPSVGNIIDGSCTDKLEVSGDVGDTVIFSICVISPPTRYIHFSSAGWVHKDGDDPSGYSWHTEKIGGRNKIWIVFKITSSKDFATEIIQFSANTMRYEYELKILRRGKIQG